MKKVLSPVTYLVEINENVCKKHVNQMMENHTMGSAQPDRSEWNISEWDLDTEHVENIQPVKHGLETENTELRVRPQRKRKPPDRYVLKQGCYLVNPNMIH